MNMTRFPFYLFLLAAVGLASCEKVIDLDLNVANPAPVFEAYMENDSVCYVKATLTSSYYDASESPAMVDGSFTISDNNGNSESLVHEGNGIYRGQNLRGVIGTTYTLTANWDNNTYTATSTMQPLVGIDSFTRQPISDFFGPPQPGRPPRFWIYVNYTDPGMRKNYYAIRTTYLDSTDTGVMSVTDYSIDNDELNDGIATRSFTSFTPFEPGDTLSVELASLDAETWLYFRTLQDALGGAGAAGAAPANPTTNFSEGALGYFGAWSKEVRQYVVRR